MALPHTVSTVESHQQAVTTTFLIPNLHCPTCVTTIASSLALLHPKPLDISTSILAHSVTVCHDAHLSVSAITKALEDEAFEVHSMGQSLGEDHDIADLDLEKGYGLGETEGNAGHRRWSFSQRSATNKGERGIQRHVERCGQCQAEKREMNENRQQAVKPSLGDDSAAAASPVVVTSSLSPTPSLHQASLAIGGMTCSSCVGSISDALGRRGWIRSVNVNLLNNSATVLFEGREHILDITEAIEDIGYEATVQHVDDIQDLMKPRPRSPTSFWRATFAIGGMTCSSCVGTITKAVKQLEYVGTVEVNLVSNSATIVFKGEEHLSSIKQAIEDVGYEASIDDVLNLDESRETDLQRKVAIRVVGMYCSHCPPRISDALNKSFGEKVQVERLPTPSDPILRIGYIPQAPDFTIRQIVAAIAAVDAAFEPFVYHPPSLEQRSQEMRAREQRRILLRLALSIVVAIPTFIVGIVLMSLVKSSSPRGRFIMEPMWAGRVSRAEWALFIMATPVYFFAADVFHVRALKELRAMWRPRSTTPLLRRFYRFGSMNLLISLGTTIAYFSSIAELAITATQPVDSDSIAASPSYFDSVVFLTMFLLIGRFLEAYSKAKTGDAVALLGKLRPTEALLVDPIYSQLSAQGQLHESTEAAAHKTPVDLLDVGDTVKVLHGASPPSDGAIVEGEAKFDESSLTGESRLVAKHVGDGVFAGTVNKGRPILVRILNVSGTSMLDQIVRVVREGQAKRAPIERVADVITSHFVPFVVLIGVSTWIIWLALGLSGSLPASYRDTSAGGWPLWSLQFSIAVFVIACPCGIGLAAPTALFVGGGLAAQHGILVKGGGEAFQEASGLDCIVFDKTGTLTEGGEPTVTAYECLSTEDEKIVLGMVQRLEESSSHPIARALTSFCKEKVAKGVNVGRITEIPGKGMRGIFRSSSVSQREVEIILGNEALMSDHGIDIGPNVSATLDAWKSQGKSVALFATSVLLKSAGEADADRATAWQLSAVFAASDRIRPESAAVVRALQSRGIEVWMLSGDNPTTARAVGKMVGIGEDNVIAGVLPEQKAEKIQYLQKTSVRRGRQGARESATVAMVGDGINDAPALTMADVGIAIGSGSDVAISSAEFVLMSSRLTSLLVLIDLSRIVFRRVWFNFGWALVYNLVALPIAAGVLYPVKSNGSHIRLDPVWASLAMALSSVSVVCSSLLLRSRLPGVGFRSVESPSKV